MISLFGKIALSFALCFALMQSALPLFGYYRKNIYALAIARPAAVGQFFCVAIAYLLLTIAFGRDDFSILYVAANSHPHLPIMYKLTAVWGGHEGSILLWVLLLSVWSLALAITQKNNSALPVILSVMGFISLCFLFFLLLTSNPFTIATERLMPADLNPLLQDPGFVIHPPMLYTGYVGFSAAFACTLAALMIGKLDKNWIQITRTFAISAWCFLTLGITLGSWWAYRVLGWGGFWFWDPVENASLLPWISGTALIHILLLVEKRGTAKAWAAMLALITFALSVLGTFLVRSGVLISAHTFANDPARGIFLLILLSILTTAALAVYVVQIPKLISPTKIEFAPISRETGLLFNSIILFIVMFTILLGTIYPLIIDALHLGVVSVGAPYFNTVMTPLVFLVMTLMGFGVLARWGEDTLLKLWQHAYKKIMLSFVVAIALLIYGTHQLNVTALISLTLAFWILLSVRPSIKTLPGMTFAHAGFAILVIGVMLSSVLTQEREVRIKAGDGVMVGPYQFFFIEDHGVQGPNYKGIQASFEVLKNARHVVNLYPEKRIYLARNMVMTTVDIHPGLFRDLYIALGEPLDQNYWSVRIYYKPFIRWIWLGGILMMIGGIMALFCRPKNRTA